MILPVGTYLFSCSHDSPYAVQQAKDYCHDLGITADDIKIIKVDGKVEVITRREIPWPEKRL